MNLLEGIPNERGHDRHGGSVGPMTGDISEPMTAEIEDLRRFKAECTRGVLDGFPGLPKPEARREAALLMAAYAKNRKYTWEALRSALSRHPDLVAQVDKKGGPIDSLPWGIQRRA